MTTSWMNKLENDGAFSRVNGKERNLECQKREKKEMDRTWKSPRKTICGLSGVRA